MKAYEKLNFFVALRPFLFCMCVLFGLNACSDEHANFHSGVSDKSPLGTTPSTVVLYASPIGTGSACSQSAPCSLSSAQQAVREQRASNVTGVQVQLADGTYRLSSTWVFGATDSGTPGNPVVWTAAPAAHPIISGATQVRGWSQVGKSSVWSATVPANSNTRQLYVNGTAAPVAQQTPAQLGFKGGWRGSSTGYDISGDSAAMAWFAHLTATQVANVEFDYPAATGPWNESRRRVASYSAGKLKMVQPCWNNLTNLAPFSQASGVYSSMNTSTMPALIGNALALIQPGQWFLDAAANTLYYQPVAGQQMAALDVELPVLERLLEGAGSLANPLHDLTFSGLQFSYATWNDPSNNVGFVDLQSNLRMTLANNQGWCTFSTPPGSCPFGSLTQPLANVSFSASNNITLRGNTFTHLGGAGLAFMYGSSNNLIDRNTFSGIASTAIWLGCTYDPTPTNAADAAGIKQNCSPHPSLVASDVIGTNEIMTGNTVSNNVIHNIGTDYSSACGITLLFSQGTTITHNEIYDVPYSAITAGIIQGHVDDSSHPENATNINADNTISNNLLHDFMQVRGDGGAIYIEGHQAQYYYEANGVTIDPVATLAHGMQVTGNVAYDGKNTNFTLYDDAGAEWINWQGNAAYNNHVQNADQGGCNPTGHIWVTGNYTSSSLGVYACETPPVDVHASSNVTISNSPQPGDIPASILQNAGPTSWRGPDISTLRP